MQPMLCRSVPLLVVLMLGCAAAPAAEPHLVATPRASVLPASPTNRPFLGADHALAPVDLAARGYAETELVVSGFASVYDRAPRGEGWAVAASGVPYATRILVRRPVDASKSSGRVVVELLEAEGGYDAAPLWGLSWDYFLRRGDAWVGVTVQPQAVAALRRFDGVRYARLAFAGPRALPCANAVAAQSAATAPAQEPGLAWDLIAQVGALLRSSSKENPLLQFNPRRVVLAGHARAAGYVMPFARELHAALRLGDGDAVFDGYLVAGDSVPVPLNSCGVPAIEPASSPQPAPQLDVPFVAAPGIADAPRASDLAAGLPAAADLAIAGIAVPASTGAPAEDACREPRGVFPVSHAFNALWQQYDDLLLRQQPMVAATGGEAEAGDEVLRTAHRLARAQGPCALPAAQQKLRTAQLKTQFKTRAAYLQRLSTALDEAVSARRLTTEDAAANKATAARITPAF